MATLNIKNFPRELYRQLKKRARERHRSMAQEATHILSEALVEPELHSILELRGLGKEVWKGIEAAKHIERERQAWD